MTVYIFVCVCLLLVLGCEDLFLVTFYYLKLSIGKRMLLILNSLKPLHIRCLSIFIYIRKKINIMKKFLKCIPALDNVHNGGCLYYKLII